MAERPPRINYNPSKKGARDFLVLGASPVDILASIERIKGKQQRLVNKAALAAFFELGPQISGRRYADIDARYFPIGRKLHVPVNPFLYTRGVGIESILWPSFWSALKLREDQLAVYATILDMAFLSTVDFSGCALEFADLGCPEGEKIRKPHIVQRSDLPTLTTAELKEFTDPFAEVFLKLVEEIKGEASKKPHHGASEAPADWYLDQSPP
jgi:hypothetical protein